MNDKTPLSFNDLLIKEDVDPASVLIMRHRPTEVGLRRVLPWLAEERLAMFNAYQRLQGGKNPEIALTRAKYLASFIGIEPGLAHFVGLFERQAFRSISKKEYWKIDGIRELHEHGMSAAALRSQSLLFDLEITEHLQNWRGCLIIEWTGLERSWYRWAKRNTFPVSAILPESSFAQGMPGWSELILNWPELKSLPKSWELKLSQWRGIYLIFDRAREKYYVGSASGSENILGRWLNYSATGHGGNKELRKSDPNDLFFSILQRTSPDAISNEIVALESNWKSRLHSRQFGLNEN